MKKHNLPAVVTLLALFILAGIFIWHDNHPGSFSVSRLRNLWKKISAETTGEYTSSSGPSAVYEEQGELFSDPVLMQEPGWLQPFTGRSCVRVQKDMPCFTDADRNAAEQIIRTAQTMEEPGMWLFCKPLDELGRCQAAAAVVGPETMATGERESIRDVQPSGWNQAVYDSIEGGFLWNRCHLVGYQLCGVSADEKNLVTGTHYLNITGMQPWEDWIAEYVYRTKEHVLYRVTPIFEGDNLVASGILLEAEGMETRTFHFCVYCFNAEPGIYIDYKTGESEEKTEDEFPADIRQESEGTEAAYILNTNSGKFHSPQCEAAQEIAWRNRIEWVRSREELCELGYVPCGACRP